MNAFNIGIKFKVEKCVHGQHFDCALSIRTNAFSTYYKQTRTTDKQMAEEEEEEEETEFTLSFLSRFIGTSPASL